MMSASFRHFAYALSLGGGAVLAQPQAPVIDRVVANVAGRIVLYSELVSCLEQVKSQGEVASVKSGCACMEDLMFDRLLLEQARIDSVTVDDKQVEAELNRRITYFEQQIGGRDKLEKFYGKSIERIKADFRDQVRDPVLDLDAAGDAEEGLGLGDQRVALEHLRPDHQVDEAALVLERQEHDALRRAGALPADHDARVARARAVARRVDRLRVGQA